MKQDFIPSSWIIRAASSRIQIRSTRLMILSPRRLLHFDTRWPQFDPCKSTVITLSIDPGQGRPFRGKKRITRWRSRDHRGVQCRHKLFMNYGWHSRTNLERFYVLHGAPTRATRRILEGNARRRRIMRSHARLTRARVNTRARGPPRAMEC